MRHPARRSAAATRDRSTSITCPMTCPSPTSRCRCAARAAGRGTSRRFRTGAVVRGRASTAVGASHPCTAPSRAIAFGLDNPRVSPPHLSDPVHSSAMVVRHIGSCWSWEQTRASVREGSHVSRPSRLPFGPAARRGQLSLFVSCNLSDLCGSRQEFSGYLTVAERWLVALQAQAPQPCRDVHACAPYLNTAGASNAEHTASRKECFVDRHV